MKIHSRTVYDIESLEVIEDAFYEWNGEVCLCKGEAKAQQQFNNDLTTKLLAQQQAYLQKYSEYVDRVLAGSGYLPGVREAATSEAIQSVPANYNSAARQIMTNAASRGISGGGTTPGSGLLNQGLGELYSSEEQQKSNLLNNITLGGQQNVAAAESGLLNAGSIVGSSAPSSIAGAASNANTANQQSGLLGTIIGGGLGVLGSALGKGGALAGCWVAAELYGGWFTPETCAIREWLSETWYMQPFVWLYRELGIEWAWLIKRNMPARLLTTRLFDWFLRQANG